MGESTDTAAHHEWSNPECRAGLMAEWPHPAAGCPASSRASTDTAAPWHCTRNGVTKPCGDCDGCRYSARESTDTAALALAAEARAYAGSDEYGGAVLLRECAATVESQAARLAAAEQERDEARATAKHLVGVRDQLRADHADRLADATEDFANAERMYASAMQENAQLTTRLAAAAEAIQNAPHGDDCPAKVRGCWNIPPPEMCNCWKRAALAAVRGTPSVWRHDDGTKCDHRSDLIGDSLASHWCPRDETWLAAVRGTS